MNKNLGTKNLKEFMDEISDSDESEVGGGNGEAPRRAASINIIPVKYRTKGGLKMFKLVPDST